MTSACYHMSEYILVVIISCLCLDTLGLWLPRPIVKAYDEPDTGNQCNREPAFSRESNKTPGDQGFRIRIVGRDERYTPQHVYTVVLNGTFPKQEFQGFMLIAAPFNAIDETTSMGTFQILDPKVTTFDDECPHIVRQVDLRPKTSVELLWIAPPSGVGCIEFRATVIQSRTVWLKDEGALKQIFCEA